MEHIHIVLSVLVIVDVVAHIIWSVKSTKLDRRLAKVGAALVRQNELLEKKCELLETIFAGQYEEVKKKYSIREE